MSFFQLLQHYNQDYNSEEDSDYVPSDQSSDSDNSQSDCESEISESYESGSDAESLESLAGDFELINESTTMNDIPTHIRVYGGQKWLKKNMNDLKKANETKKAKKTKKAKETKPIKETKKAKETKGKGTKNAK